MKKLLCILLTAILCLSVVSCTDTPETTPNEIEPPEIVTPNEVETVEPIVTPTEPVTTPNEIETPTEPEPPEVVTPTEQPNEPTEEPEVTEPVTPEADEPEENVVILPEADENTKYITIEFPEDFPEEPYTEPNLVSPEEFEWGEYVPFVVAVDQQPTFLPVYSIISSNFNTIDEGIELYKKLNNKYLEVYNGEKLTDWYGDEMTDEMSDYLYKSRVVYVSPEADIIGRFKLIPKNDYPYRNHWSEQYDVFLNGEIDHTFFNNDVSSARSIGSFDEYIMPIKLYFHEKTADNVVMNSNSETVYQYKSDRVSPYYLSEKTKEQAFYFSEKNYAENGSDLVEKHTILFLSQDRSRITHIISYDWHFTVPQKKYDVYNITAWLQDGDIQIIEFCNIINNHYTQALYSLDINTGKLTYLESYAYNPSISPDGKYLIYFNSIGGEVFDWNTKPLPERQGMYVKNLKTGSTVNYPISRWWNGRLISWVNEEKLMDLIEE